MDKQLHAGIVAAGNSKGTTLWHTGERGGKKGYWCGNWYYRTPLQLLRECESTIDDLLKNHPHLKRQKESSDGNN